jgi:hypothetical protein
VLMTDFTWPGAFLNNSIITAASAGAAWWRSKQLADFAIKRNDRKDRLTPVGPFIASMILAFSAALQIIFAVTHLSYYRKGPLVTDLFDR